MLYYGCIRASLEDKYFVGLVLCLKHDGIQVPFLVSRHSLQEKCIELILFLIRNHCKLKLMTQMK